MMSLQDQVEELQEPLLEDIPFAWIGDRPCGADREESEDITPFLPLDCSISRTRLACKGTIPWRALFRFLRLLYAIVCALLLLSAMLSLLPFSPVDPFDAAFAAFHDPLRPISPASSEYPARYLRSVLPVPCHSHNDYWRQTPLYAALGSGCVSVEADVWLIKHELYVGHTRASLSRNETLRQMYIDPIAEILVRMNSRNKIGEPAESTTNGVFYMDPGQSLTLLIDFKVDGEETWQVVHAQLEPLRKRGWLTHWNTSGRFERPVTAVATGVVPFNLVVANETYRDIFFDAPLDALADPSDDLSLPAPEVVRTSSVGRFQNFKYNPSNSHYASVDFKRAIGTLWDSSLDLVQIHTLQSQIRLARERGLIPRYWGTPRWPRGLRDQVWGVLVREEVGVVNVDDLRAVRKGSWGVWPQGARKPNTR